MHRVVREYRKIDIARMMLDTAINLYLEGADRFSVIQLAAAAEEVLAGMIQRKRSGPASGPQNQTAREMTIATISEILKTRGITRTEKQIGDFLNGVRNQTKHHGDKDKDTIVCDAEGEAWDALCRAVNNYGRCENHLSEAMMAFGRLAANAPPGARPSSDSAV
ncbi:HEPN domain-containing protein (plasmid) [Paraburkholderia kururiensis]|uniref:hypothetical protein n=1 Tax=Paraburkholderia kururiensis TaxID=984307 RepID=UPI0039A5A053